MTTAETVAARLDGDGQRFETVDGVEFDELCLQTGGFRYARDSDGIGWEWKDGSRIWASGHMGAWDVVHPECICGRCWEGGVGEGHPDCLDRQCAECGDVVSDELDLSRDGLCCGCAEDSLAGTEPGWMDAEPEMEGE